MSIPHDDPRLTAYALGELGPTERSAFESALASDVLARTELAAICETSSLLERELRGAESFAGSAPALSARRRASLLAEFAAKGRAEPNSRALPRTLPTLQRRRRVRVWLTALAPAAAAALLVLYTQRESDESSPLAIEGKAGGDPSAQTALAQGTPSVAAQPTRQLVPLATRERWAPPSNSLEDRMLEDRVSDVPAMRAPSARATAPMAQAARAFGTNRLHKEQGREQGEGFGAFGSKAAALPGLTAPQTWGEESGGLSRESYDTLEDNLFVAVATDPRSTFSIDVDTAGYALVRRFLDSGQLPPRGAVRIEELVNYFSYRYPQPGADAPFSIVANVAHAPWNRDHQLVRVALQARHVAASARPPANLVFLIDVSGSMAAPNKLELVKYGLRQLTAALGARDRVSIVTYAGNSGLVLAPTPGSQREKILQAIDRLEAGGSTNGGAGIELSYSLARQHFVAGNVNRVLLATDGDFNVGVTSQSELVELVQRQAQSGVFLSVLGFGDGNYQDSMLEKLADKGNGNYAYIDGPAEAQKVLVEQATGTLLTLAKDVKLQLEFNPGEVSAFRLIGYENRMLEHPDFNDDAKDAGELGADHSVTALYEVIPAGSPAPGSVDALKFQPAPAPPAKTLQAFRGQLLQIKVRYQPPSGGPSQLIEQTLRGPVQELDEDFRFAAAVAEFGLLLRESRHRGQASYSQVLKLAQSSLGDGRDRRAREQFVGLVRKARGLSENKD